jgi:uncharacterized protein
MPHAPGDPIRVEVTKWGDHQHWEFDGVWLGTDEYGEWLGFPVGTHNSRPGFAFDSEVDAVTLVPHTGHWMATFQAPGIWCNLYIDVSTPATWDGDVLRTVDLDLDVVRRDTGEVFIDDEDEFLEHQVTFGYPAEVIAAARASADELFAAVKGGVAPYDGKAHLRWLGLIS